MITTVKAVVLAAVILAGVGGCGGNPLPETFQCGPGVCYDGDVCAGWSRYGQLEYMCTVPCTQHSDCDTGCCSPSAENTKACVPASLCNS